MPMEVIVTGNGANSNIQTQIDPSHLAQRTSIRPDEHAVAGQIGGHYAVTAWSGTIAASLAANSVLFAMRWADSTKVMIIKQVTVTLGLTGTPGTLQAYDFELIRGTAFTANYSANNTNITPATTAQKMRTGNMASTLFSVSGGIQVCTTAGMTGATVTLDTAGVGAGVLPGTAAAGLAGNIELYREVAFGQHPLVLSTNEGFVIRNHTAWGATATGIMGVLVHWVEAGAY